MCSVLSAIFPIFGIITIILTLSFRITYSLSKVFNIANYFLYNISWFNFTVKSFIIILFKIKRYESCNKMHIYFKQNYVRVLSKRTGFKLIKVTINKT